MSLHGAMRLFVAGGRAAGRHASAGTDGELAPTAPGAWAAWARAQEAREADERTDAVCVAPGGRVGRIVRRFDGARWVDECEIA